MTPEQGFIPALICISGARRGSRDELSSRAGLFPKSGSVPELPWVVAWIWFLELSGFLS